MRWYFISFEVDNGASYNKDTALVCAGSKEEAEVFLRDHVSSLDHETCVSEIFSVNVFSGCVFTGNHGRA